MQVIEPDEDGVILRVAPSQGRRMLMLAALLALGLLLVLLGFQVGVGVSGTVLIAIGALTLSIAEVMRRSTRARVLLISDGLVDSFGTHIATWDQMHKIERGAFAMKPSNGFSIVLLEKHPRAWRPGIWWRLRGRVGIGGVLRAREARFMAEYLAVELAKRENGAR